MGGSAELGANFQGDVHFPEQSEEEHVLVSMCVSHLKSLAMVVPDNLCMCICIYCSQKSTTISNLTMSSRLFSAHHAARCDFLYTRSSLPLLRPRTVTLSVNQISLMKGWLEVQPLLYHQYRYRKKTQPCGALVLVMRKAGKQMPNHTCFFLLVRKSVMHLEGGWGTCNCSNLVCRWLGKIVLKVSVCDLKSKSIGVGCVTQAVHS